MVGICFIFGAVSRGIILITVLVRAPLTYGHGSRHERHCDFGCGQDIERGDDHNRGRRGVQGLLPALVRIIIEDLLSKKYTITDGVTYCIYCEGVAL